MDVVYRFFEYAKNNNPVISQAIKKLKEKNQVSYTSNDGSVIISDYKDTVYSGGSHYIYFTVSTLETPLDFEHPVAGNRRFGLFNTTNNPDQWTLYTMGVDRINDLMDGILLQNFMFNNADMLWKNVFTNAFTHINNNQGCLLYTSPSPRD